MSTGQLRVYFGAAPGVGKPYKMLEEGHRRLGRGTDVVIGFVETHGRQPIVELIEGLEVIPRATLTYRGTTLEEMDLAAVLARRPQVALVDELAHTNASSSPNEKRWQDIEEGWDHRDHDSERAAPGVAQRRCVRDHRRTAAGDRPGCGGAAGAAD
jgi:two-component system, OmpR family, sensor histidine kinase KdpD